MKKQMTFLGLLASVVLIAGCAENRTKIGEGAGIGGLLGATVGGIVGHQSGDGGAGVLIGGAVGAATGAMVGSQMEKPATSTTTVTQTQYVAIPQPVSGQLTIQQVVDLSRQGVSGDQIINQIRQSNPKYYLTTDDIDYMRRNGVSQRVIEIMQAYR